MTKLQECVRMCTTIGNIPSSYVDSLSYEEQLLWLCKFLNEKVLPKLNYMIDYFDNLNVQTEINKKLEAMAESGELQEIISAYINANSVLSYNTVNAMKNASNLINGSTAETLGKNTINDGLGSLYKIRTITSSDTVDEVNIVSLNFSDTLIAEKIDNDMTIFIGDSYGALYEDGWVEKVASKMGLTFGVNAYKFCLGGYGFSRENGKFIDLLRNRANLVKNKNLIKKIIVCGGLNDTQYTEDTIKADMIEFVNYVNTTYPNAHIYIGMIGNTKLVGTDIRLKVLKVLRAYQSCSSLKNCSYLSGVEYVMHYYGYFISNDDPHPTAEGNKMLGNAIYQALYNEFKFNTDIEVITVSGVTLRAQVINNRLELSFFGNISAAMPTGLGFKTVDLGSAGENFLRNVYSEYSVIPVVLNVVYSGAQYNCNGYITINNQEHLVLNFVNPVNSTPQAISILSNVIDNNLLYF